MIPYNHFVVHCEQCAGPVAILIESEVENVETDVGFLLVGIYVKCQKCGQILADDKQWIPVAKTQWVSNKKMGI